MKTNFICTKRCKKMPPKWLYYVWVKRLQVVLFYSFSKFTSLIFYNERARFLELPQNVILKPVCD